MKLVKNFKKGFTLVELVVVIAIIGVLAGVGVAVYSGITKNAKETADSEIISQLNLQLKAKSVLEGPNQTAYDAYLDAKEIGFDLNSLRVQSGGSYAWDQKEDLFSIVKDDQLSGKDFKTWLFVNEIKSEATYSQFLTNIAPLASVSVKAGFDAGLNNSVSAIVYSNDATNEGVVIRTNGGKLTVNAKNDTVKHYGALSEADVQKVAGNSYHEFGAVSLLKVGEGHIDVEEGAFVLKATGDMNKVTIKEGAQVLQKNDEKKSNLKISSTNEIEAFRDSVNSGVSYEGFRVELISNISLNDGWTPIDGFKGEFNGNNHIISNLNTKNNTHTEDDYTFGLFGTLDGAPEVKGITFADSEISFKRKDNNAVLSGFLVGLVKGATNISDIIVSSSCTIDITAKATIGGIIGRWKHNSVTGECTITNCTNNANMTLNTPNVSGIDIKSAGILGFADTGGGKLKIVLTTCTNNGNISATATGSAYIAGMYNHNSLQQRPLLGNRVGATYEVISGGGNAVAYYENNCKNNGAFNSSSNTSGCLTYMMSGKWQTEANAVETSNYKYMVAYHYDTELDGTYIFDNCTYIGSNTCPVA